MAKLNDEDREVLTAYLDGELDEATARGVETRLNLDPTTRAEADALQQAWSMLDYLPRAEPSTNFTHRTLERLALQTGVSRRRVRPPWAAVLTWAVAVLLAASAGFGCALLLWRPHAAPLPESTEQQHRSPSEDQREKDWLRRQPAAFRNKLSKLTPEQRRQAVEERRHQEEKEALSWRIAVRFWDDLIRDKRALPHQLADFPSDVQSYVKVYLLPRLTPGEAKRLQHADGHWPEYPMELVALADRHPLALPDTRWPRKVEDLPEEILRKLFRGKTEKHRPQLKHVNDLAAKIGLGQAVAQRAKTRPPDGVVLPHELWPYRQKCLSAPVREFMKAKLLPVLSPNETLALVQVESEGVWPDYPLKLKELAENHGLRVPWQSLPGSAQMWDRYRVQPYAAEEKTAWAGR